MRKIVVSQFLSLDGVIEDPGGAEGFDRGGWAFKFDRGPEGDKFKYDELMASDSLLLGRVTYEGFAAAWPSMSDAGGFAEKMNGMAKLVVSSTLSSTDWNNSTLISGDPMQAVSEIKQQGGQDILVTGSAQLAQALARNDLVDEYRLMVFPLILGAGKRLFEDNGKARTLRLSEASSLASGILLLRYEPAA